MAILAGSAQQLVAEDLSIEDKASIQEKCRLQREMLQTGTLSFKYLLCGMQDVPVQAVEEFLEDLKTVASVDPSAENLEPFIRNSFPGPQQYWREVKLIFDGPRVHEFATELSGEEATRDTLESVDDGAHHAAYWHKSGQVTVFAGNSPLKHLSMGDVRSVLPDAWFADRVVRSPNGLLRIRRDSDRVTLDGSTGMLLEYRAPNYAILQTGFQEYDGVLLPLLRVSVSFRDERLYRLAAVLLLEAEFNHPIEDNFRLQVPAGTVVADARQGMDKIRPHRVQVASDALEVLESNTLSTDAVDEGRRRFWLRANLVAILIVAILLLLRKARKQSQPRTTAH